MVKKRIQEKAEALKAEKEGTKEEPKKEVAEGEVEAKEEEGETKEEDLDEKERKKLEKKQKKEEEKKRKEEEKKRREEERKKKEEEGGEAPVVKMKTRLDNRVIDIRTPGKQAIFKISSMVCHLFREFCLKNDFVEIHTPKLIGGSSEGGTNVFNFEYFGTKACLAQSPQLYKQMCVMGDFQRVFEVGPVFRAENSFTHRHMCEFVCLDVEMTIKEHYFELMEFFGELFPFLFNGIAERCEKELKAVNEQFEFAPFKCKYPVVKLTFVEGIQLLKENGIEWPEDEDLSTEVEKKLGELGTVVVTQSRPSMTLTSTCCTATHRPPGPSTLCSATTTPSTPAPTTSS